MMLIFYTRAEVLDHKVKIDRILFRYKYGVYLTTGKRGMGSHKAGFASEKLKYANPAVGFRFLMKGFYGPCGFPDCRVETEGLPHPRDVVVHCFRKASNRDVEFLVVDF